MAIFFCRSTKLESSNTFLVTKNMTHATHAKWLYPLYQVVTCFYVSMTTVQYLPHDRMVEQTPL